MLFAMTEFTVKNGSQETCPDQLMFEDGSLDAQLRIYLSGHQSCHLM